MTPLTIAVRIYSYCFENYYVNHSSMSLAGSERIIPLTGCNKIIKAHFHVKLSRSTQEATVP